MFHSTNNKSDIVNIFLYSNLVSFSAPDFVTFLLTPTWDSTMVHLHNTNKYTGNCDYDTETHLSFHWWASTLNEVSILFQKKFVSNLSLRVEFPLPNACKWFVLQDFFCINNFQRYVERDTTCFYVTKELLLLLHRVLYLPIYTTTHTNRLWIHTHIQC